MFKSDFIVSGAEVNLSSDTSPQTLVSSWWIAVLVPILLPPPSSSLTLTLLSTCSAPSHPSPSISHPFRWIMHRFYLSLSLLVSITIDRNFENFLNRSDSPPLIMHPIPYLSLFPEKRRKITSLLDNSIHYPPILPSIPFSITLFIHRFRPSINHLQYFSTLSLFTPQHFHSLDFSVPIDGAHRNLIPYSPTLTSLTLLPPLPSTLQSTTIDLLRERSRKSISRTKTKTRKGKRRWGVKRSSWGITREGDTLTFGRSILCNFSTGKTCTSSRTSRLFYFEIPSIHHASETRLAPPPPPPRSALPQPANLSFLAFFHLSRSSCHASSSSSPPPPVFPVCVIHPCRRFSRTTDFPPLSSPPLDWRWSLIK